MRKLVPVVLMVFVLTVLYPLCSHAESQEAPASGKNPIIHIGFIPEYGHDGEVRGLVFMEDDSVFDPDDYRIALYLQISERGTYWVKPYYDHPYADIHKDGTFSITYATGGQDKESRYLYVMLIPSWYLPDSDFNQTKNLALDYVEITRTKTGFPTVSPERQIPIYNIENGICGDCPWTVDSSGCLTLGDGEKEYHLGEVSVYDDFFYANSGFRYGLAPSYRPPWKQYLRFIREVKVLPGVHADGNSAGLFRSLTNAVSIDLSGLDTSSVIFGSYMFSGCSGLKSLDLSSMRTAKTMYMNDMFSGCTSLTALDLSGFDITSVKDMRSMFQGCSSLETLNLGGLNAFYLDEMSKMFEGCTSLRNLNLSGFTERKDLDDGSAYNVFSGCDRLEEVDLSGFTAETIRQIFLSPEDDNGIKRIILPAELSCHEKNDLAYCKSLDNFEVLFPDGTALQKKPEIMLQSVPLYGERGKISGIVSMRDGSAYSPEDYRIALYIQTKEKPGYRLKPGFLCPSARIEKDGSFSVVYAAWFGDQKATDLYVLLIPSDLKPNSDFERTEDAALDYVRITRDPFGSITIFPDRANQNR